MADAKMELLYPHSPDVLEREYLDGGFSAGWCHHAKPVPKYFFDCHIHYNGGKEGSVIAKMEDAYNFASLCGTKKAMIMMQTYGVKWNPNQIENSIMDHFPYFSVEDLKNQVKGFAKTEKYYLGIYLNYSSPEPQLVEDSVNMGARMFKLHNAPVIENNVHPGIWHSDEWAETFKAIEKHNMALNFHVTQRLSPSAYTGGGRNTYWVKGWESGCKYKNEDLLQSFLSCVDKYPGINFIGAHQLHIGWERLDKLFGEYNNLHIDSSVGCRLLLYDNFYEHDKRYLREMFIKNADRILFGTDTLWGDGPLNHENTMMIQDHMRYILALDLPQEALDKICYKNSERLFKV